MVIKVIRPDVLGIHVRKDEYTTNIHPGDDPICGAGSCTEYFIRYSSWVARKRHLCPWAVFGIAAQPRSSKRNAKNRQWIRVALYQEDQIFTENLKVEQCFP